MFGVVYLAASDFSTFSYPCSPSETSACFESHETEIEERYCLKQHIRDLDDTEWESFLARKIALFSDCEDELCSPTETDLDSASTTQSGCFDDFSSISACVFVDYSSDSDREESTVSTEGEEEYKNVGLAVEKWASGSLVASNVKSLVNEYTTEKRNNRPKKFLKQRRLVCNNSNQVKRKCVRKKYRNVTPSDTSSYVSANKLPKIRPGALKRTQSSTSSLKPSDTDVSDSSNPWKCPHCPWIQHTQRLPDFLRHQRSHFISRTDWPCPNPACGKSFARKDSLKRHLNNRSTPCERPPGYTVC